jgi:hypothetical protein
MTSRENEGMRALKLYDFLNLTATAVDEAEYGRFAFADLTWAEAATAADGMTGDARKAAEAILAATGPDGGQHGRADLWNALDAAATAVLALTGGQRELASVVMPDALAATDALDHDLQMAVLTVLAEAQDMAGDGATA